MAILRVRKSRFSVVSTEMLERTDMSWKAKGLLCYMLSRPDDWRFNERFLYERFQGGKDLVSSGLKELESLGYLEREKVRDESGMFRDVRWTVRETPSEPEAENPQPRSGNPMSGTPMSENPQLLNTDRDLILKEPKKENSLSAKESERKTFEKPTVEDVRAYCRERGNGIDPEAFWNFYESKGWMVGRNHMRSWKAAVVTWERKDAADRPRTVADKVDLSIYGRGI